MTIRTKESLSGFIASDPDLTFTSKGDARFYARVGQPQTRFEEDGTFTELDPTFTDLVMFRRSAELAHAQFQKGDNFIAEGESRTYTGNDGTEREQFVASRIGHDNNITAYDVQRAPERNPVQQEAPGRDAAQAALEEQGTRAPDRAEEQPITNAIREALAAREAELEPEPPAATSTTSPAVREQVAR